MEWKNSTGSFLFRHMNMPFHKIDLKPSSRDIHSENWTDSTMCLKMNAPFEIISTHCDYSRVSNKHRLSNKCSLVIIFYQLINKSLIGKKLDVSNNAHTLIPESKEKRSPQLFWVLELYFQKREKKSTKLLVFPDYRGAFNDYVDKKRW